jgi:hypothetical protein
MSDSQAAHERDGFGRGVAGPCLSHRYWHGSGGGWWYGPTCRGLIAMGWFGLIGDGAWSGYGSGGRGFWAWGNDEYVLFADVPGP